MNPFSKNFSDLKLFSTLSTHTPYINEPHLCGGLGVSHVSPTKLSGRAAMLPEDETWESVAPRQLLSPSREVQGLHSAQERSLTAAFSRPQTHVLRSSPGRLYRGHPAIFFDVEWAAECYPLHKESTQRH